MSFVFSPQDTFLSSVSPYPQQSSATQYGFGLFETLLALPTGIPFFDAHIARLKRGAAVFGFPESTTDEIKQALSGYLPKHDMMVKVTLAAQNSMGYRVSQDNPVWTISAATIDTVTDQKKRQEGICIGLAEHRLAKQTLAIGLKHLSRFEQCFLATERAKRQLDELICRDIDGFVVEGVSSNLFIVKGDQLFTPDIQSSGINGVMRQQILGLCEVSDELPSAIAKNLTLADIDQADEIFFCNSVRGIAPVRSYDSRRFSRWSLTEKLQAKFELSHPVRRVGV